MRALILLAVPLLAVAGEAAQPVADMTMGEAASAGAAAGAAFGPKGAAIGAAVFVAGWFVWRQVRRNRKGKG